MKTTGLKVFLAVLMVRMLFGITGAAEAAELIKLQVQMSFTPTAPFSGYMLGQQLGFYEKEGLIVELLPGGGSPVVAPIIGTNKVSIGFLETETLLLSRQKGLPLIAVASSPQSNPTAIFFPKGKGIEKLKDLEGKSMISDSSSFRHKYVKTVLESAGVSFEKVKVVDFSGPPGARIQVLLKGEVDSINMVFTNAQYKDRLLGSVEGIGYFLLRDYLDLLFRTIVVNEKFLKENPEIVRKFLRGSAKAWEYSLQHPDEAIRALIKFAPDLKEGLEKLSFEANKAFLRTAETRDKPWGWMSEKDWQQSQDLLFKLGVLAKKEPLERIYSNNFLQ